jgi:NAD(P)-dependent dehydrogenase (short-subunit alcohol dehydrogenase family)
MERAVTGPGAASSPTKEEIRACIAVLEALARDKKEIFSLDEEDRIALLRAAGLVARPDRALERVLSRAERRSRKKALRSRDRERRERTGIREARRPAVYVPPPLTLPGPGAPAPELERPLACYVCKGEYTKVHFFYDSMCPACAELNYDKRFQTAALDGRVAVVTGARVKIGFHTALKLLRAGARVIATTRFPHDAAQRYAREADFEGFKDRLAIWGLDLRHAPSVERFADALCAREARLDYVVNNACQTVRRPPAFYAHLIEHEARSTAALSPAEAALVEPWAETVRALTGGGALLPGSSPDEGALALVRAAREMPVGLVASAQLSLLRTAFDDDGFRSFPREALDADQQQVDLREVNSWRLRLAEVPTWELLEVHLVNAIAPFILAGRLKPLLLRERTFAKHIVNVSAMEGIFSRGTKTDRHPHTNMAKAALNMLTLTSAPDYARDGIFMNAVDTGWVTDEDPAVHATRKRDDLGFQPPLDIVDGAARVLDPIFTGALTGQHAWGKFFKDYRPAAW